jgi:hypothetical protein
MEVYNEINRVLFRRRRLALLREVASFIIQKRRDGVTVYMRYL